MTLAIAASLSGSWLRCDGGNAIAPHDSLQHWKPIAAWAIVRFVARYYFHLLECGTHIPDEDGIEIEHSVDVREHALREARGVMAAEVTEGTLCLSCCLEVYDENKQLVLTLPFKDAVILSGL